MNHYDLDCINIERHKDLILIQNIKRRQISQNNLIDKEINQMEYASSHGVDKNNTLESSKRNISHHYDIGNDLYTIMLGKYMQYTCAYFNKPNMTLDDAQFSKMNLIAKKLD